MNYKLISAILLTILIATISTVFTAVVYAKGCKLFCFNKCNMIVTLKNEANIDISKAEILKIPHLKIVRIKYRDEEWSRMVNKMDLPKMDNPFKNEFAIKTSKNADVNEIYNKIKEMDFVESVKLSETGCI